MLYLFGGLLLLATSCQCFAPEEDQIAFVQQAVSLSSSMRHVGYASTCSPGKAGCPRGPQAEEVEGGDAVSYAQAQVSVSRTQDNTHELSEDSEDDTLSYMQASVTLGTGNRHVGAEELAFEEEEEDDMSSWVQSAVSVSSGTRHVGTGCVTSSAGEAACLASFNEEVDEEGIEDEGDVLSYMQSDVGIEVGVRHVGADAKASSIGIEESAYYTEDVMSL